MSKQINTRIQNKYDTAVNWESCSEQSLSGELYVHSIEQENTSSIGLKFGDGIHNINDLPYITSDATSTVIKKIPTRPSLVEQIYSYDETLIQPAVDCVDNCSLSGIISASEAGTYSIWATPNYGYCWNDSSTTPVQLEWTITPVEGKIFVEGDITSYTFLNYSQEPIAFSIDWLGSGELSVTSSDKTVATATIDGKKLTLYQCSKEGTATITLSVSSDNNYLAATYEIEVTVETGISDKLDDNDWKTISYVSELGQGAQYWSVGACKKITLNGKIGNYLELNNTELYVYILGFNHNSDYEGTGIHFAGFKTSAEDGIDVCLCDTMYGEQITNSTEGYCFSMTTYGYLGPNNGGVEWRYSHIRNNILGSTKTRGASSTKDVLETPQSNTLMAALSSDLRAVLKPMIKYVFEGANVVNSQEQGRDFRAILDYITLLSEPEIFGTCYYSSNKEKKYIEQYNYYTKGNLVSKRKQSDLDTYARWWLRARADDTRYNFVSVDDEDEIYSDSTYKTDNTNRYYSYGIAPIFKV